MRDKPLEWVILVPLDAQSLEKEASTFRREELGLGEVYLPQWEVLAGQLDHSALLNRNAGTRDTHESPLAKRLASLLGKRVYLLYPAEGDVLFYEPGQPAGELSREPYEFARSLGTPLPGEPRKTVERSQVRGVAVIEGTSAAAAARALGFDAPPQHKSGLLRIIEGPSGAVVSGNYADIALTAQQLSEMLPKRNVYTLVTGPTPGRFIARLIRAGEDVGLFEFQASMMTGDKTPRLDSIKGKRTPDEIVDALGIPRDLLELSQSP